MCSDFHNLHKTCMHIYSVTTQIPVSPLCDYYFAQLQSAETDEDVQISLAVDEVMELLLATGFRRPLALLGLKDVDDLVGFLLEYHLFVKVKAEIDQFVEGLMTLGFLGHLRKNPSLWQNFFVLSEDKLTPGLFIHVLYYLKCLTMFMASF